MKSCNVTEIVISGVGVNSSVGQGQFKFIEGLLMANHQFGVMQRPGRQFTYESNDAQTNFLGAEIGAIQIPKQFEQKNLHATSLSAQTAISTLHEAWNDAGLDDVDPLRIGLIVGGSNYQQRELTLIHDRLQQRKHFLRPTYAMQFMDTDICGICTELFAIEGFAYTIGTASSSGQTAVIQAVHAVRSGQVDVCIALGALMDLSYWECQGFRSLGAMGSTRYADTPEYAARPYDKDRDGFIFGECCGAVVIESEASFHSRRLLKSPYARVHGWSMKMDRNRNPNPSLDGEKHVIKEALAQAKLAASDIDYINPHATGSIIGDEIELQAIHDCGLSHAYINTTKSIIGHGLTAAGTVEIIATLLQMKVGALHFCRNLENPIGPECNFVRDKALRHEIGAAVTLSMGFGGVSSALCLGKY